MTISLPSLKACNDTVLNCRHKGFGIVFHCISLKTHSHPLFENFSSRISLVTKHPSAWCDLLFICFWLLVFTPNFLLLWLSNLFERWSKPIFWVVTVCQRFCTRWNVWIRSFWGISHLCKQVQTCFIWLGKGCHHFSRWVGFQICVESVWSKTHTWQWSMTWSMVRSSTSSSSMQLSAKWAICLPLLSHVKLCGGLLSLLDLATRLDCVHSSSCFASQAQPLLQQSFTPWAWKLVAQHVILHNQLWSLVFLAWLVSVLNHSHADQLHHQMGLHLRCSEPRRTNESNLLCARCTLQFMNLKILWVLNTDLQRLSWWSVDKWRVWLESLSGQCHFLMTLTTPLARL